MYKEGDKIVMLSKRRSGRLWTWQHDTNWRNNHSLLDCGDGLLHPYCNDEFRPATKEEISAGYRLDDENHV